MIDLKKIQNVDIDYLTHIISTDRYDEEIFKTADEIRRKYVGEEVHLRGIIEFSNYCTQHCLYCGLRAENKNLARYRMSPEEIIERAKLIAQLGIKTIVLQSGEDPYYTTEMMCEIIQQIKKLDVAITLSLGERTFEEYRIWKELGADRYLMRHETASPQLYAKLHPGDSLENRKAHLYELKRLGYETGAGFMVGLPGQTPYDLALDLVFLKELDADMIGIGPFIPNPDTPLKDATGGDLQTTLRMIALARIVVPTANIPATTALGSINPLGRQYGLKYGANVIMPNLTPNPYRPNYSLYPGKICLFERDTACVECTKHMIKSVGLIVGEGYGYRKKTESLAEPVKK
ncbi:iron-only hydrogenase maturation protein HydE [Fervidobacterium changbaicum]|uniref:[FeFe] hydrogenase H-cluster radical SAM maturase HydE n=2 Tax=Fervidobacterium TaxID=2422 RepID=A0AAI8GCN9_FERIS|nr:MULTISPECIES: [FeFe] hydrogenase H-cluster radical SAM maturase HydE [Fervidobacterium]AMW32153.1 [FeFe] hydrogenase H-cluster radical SAM maturase HydE [Fervidobacterium islandicum]QAV33921.1 [FeFe] hydrogenase H-cluster radical SAM maturase HydE [Fervidobacterium changbaicum]SDH56049.1 iron-only hydrogenase maturation protein HydE [Fervidobacterium changbaicum]